MRKTIIMPTAKEEAQRYIDNAKAFLKEKALKKDGYYTDPKYVKLAGHAAYTGILVMLDYKFGESPKGKENVNWYRDNITKKHKKLLPVFLTAYEVLHRSMGYDGVLSSKITDIGIGEAQKIIDTI
jgi:Domain of unknown function (DUF5618)